MVKGVLGVSLAILGALDNFFLVFLVYLGGSWLLSVFLCGFLVDIHSVLLVFGGSCIFCCFLYGTW